MRSLLDLKNHLSPCMLLLHILVGLPAAPNTSWHVSAQALAHMQCLAQCCAAVALGVLPFSWAKAAMEGTAEY
jgi:hypothetical protein